MKIVWQNVTAIITICKKRKKKENKNTENQKKKQKKYLA